MKVSISPFGHDKRPSALPTLPPERAHIFRQGQLVAATYEIQGLLGSGGLGQVYDAIDQSLGRRVALKVAWEPGPRLRHEARAIAAFRHDSLPTIHGVGEHDEDDFIVLERVYGVTVADQLELAEEDLLPLQDVTQVLESSVSAVSVLHRAGLAHLDIRPANVMKTPAGRVVLLDFGLCVLDLDMTDQARLTINPAYAAPELITGDVTPDGARLADIYDLGVLGFELLTGQVPMALDSFAAVRSSSTMPRPSVKAQRPDVPEGLADLIDSMLSIDPNARPKRADDVRSRLLASTRPRPARPLNVMVVEDSPYTAKLLRRYAEDTLGKVAVRMAHDGQKAIEILREWEPDVMLLDLHMPDMSGIELCMYLRGAGLAAQCKIVSVSSNAKAKDRELLHVLGIDEFLVKDESLKESVARVLRQSEMSLAS